MYSIIAVKINSKSGFVGGDALHDAGVTVENVFVVVISVLNDFVANAAGDAAILEGGRKRLAGFLAKM